MSTSDSSSSEGEIGRNVVVPDNLTSEKASLRSKQLSQKKRKTGRNIKRTSAAKAKKEAVPATSQSPTQQLLTCASQLEQIFNKFKIEDSTRSEIRD
ncbi:hypothetical protein CDAR_543601 [Caerostris darwini]|uniref:Uncharacterized protein n=1 Tax=Caerostris darwini TaxID=1538125 RepID=A0AAV4V2E6_9ARAC|nr:hypothetical protein CDAR_543601 [Caerostris darwini]